MDEISKSESLKELDEIFISLFGKNGEIDKLSKQFKSLEKDELKTVGPLFNKVKQKLEEAIGNRRQTIREEIYKNLESEKFLLDGLKKLSGGKGHIHPVMAFEEEIIRLFGKLGFVQADAPHIDTDFNNFEVLNIPDNHPARDLWDTMYIRSELPTNNSKLLLRTHTSNSQIRILKNNRPPIRMMNIGRCFRYEAVDARHEHTFEQFEIVYVDKGVNMANLQYLSEYFFKAVLGEDIKARLRPKYYPFVEPGVGVDASCVFCKGKGCRICGGTGWMELAGAGMIHPNVLKAAGINPDEYSGIAWGFGPERMVMLKEGIEDMRVFKNGDLAFLKKY